MLAGWCFRKASGGESLSFLCLPSCFQSSVPWNRCTLVWADTRRGPDKCVLMWIVDGDRIISLCDEAMWTLDRWIGHSVLLSQGQCGSLDQGNGPRGFAGLLILKRIRLTFILPFLSFLFLSSTFDSPACILLADPLPLRMQTVYQGFKSCWLTSAPCWFGKSVTLVRVSYERAP